MRLLLLIGCPFPVAPLSSSTFYPSVSSLFLCGFPLFGEGQDFLLTSWSVSGRSQKTWFKTETSWSAT